MLDASALVRATVPPVDDRAVEWLRDVVHGRFTGHAPELVYAETTNALRRVVRAGELSAAHAHQVVEYVRDLPLRIARLRPLAREALATSLAAPVSAYDAYYLVLARALDATLVTADRRLAEQYGRVALLA